MGAREVSDLDLADIHASTCSAGGNDGDFESATAGYEVDLVVDAVNGIEDVVVVGVENGFRGF